MQTAIDYTSEITGQMSMSALVIEDDVATAEAIGKAVASSGFAVRLAHTLEQARSLADEQLPSLVLADLGMPDGNGVDVVRELRVAGVEDFIVISGSREQERVIESLRAGVSDFLLKPVKLSEIHRVVERVVDAREARRVGVAIPVERATVEPARLVGQSDAARQLRQQVQRVANLKPVRAIIAGASGVGKRNIAASIHHESDLSGRALCVNCAEEVDESAPLRFFGRGANGGQSRASMGYMEMAHGGTLVLDDISRLPISLQSSLKTCIDTGLIAPVNGFASRKVDCGIIAILREPFSEAMNGGRLRDDLYYSLAESVITVPPLADREEDTLEIAERAIRELNTLTGTDKALSDELRERLANYSWPGNVIELKSTLRAAYAGTEPDEEIELSKVLMPALSDGAADPAASLVGNSFWDVEKKLLLATLDYTDGNKRQAAKILGISLKTLYNRLHAYS